MNIYIATYDANIFIMKYYQYFFNKYWDKDTDVKILGFNPPNFKLEKNFEFISLGDKQINGPQGWSNHLRNFFENIDDEHFIFGLDDYMVAREVNHKILNVCKNEITSNKNVGRVDLQCSLRYARSRADVLPYKVIDGVRFLKLKHDIDIYSRLIYKITCAYSIWRRDYFLDYLWKDASPWEFEELGSAAAQNNKREVIGTFDDWAVKQIELLSDKWPNIINIRGLRSDDVKAIKKLQHKKDRIKQFQKVMNNLDVGYGDWDWEKVIYGD